MIAYIALGSNRGDRLAHLRGALAELPALGVAVRATSATRETLPVGAAGRARFLNCVAEVETRLPPRVLWRRLRRLERRLGRHRRGGVRNPPRTLDLDLIAYANVRLRAPELTLPHPRYAQRRFVLDGLADLIPGSPGPGTDQTITRLRRRSSGPSGRILAPSVPRGHATPAP